MTEKNSKTDIHGAARLVEAVEEVEREGPDNLVCTICAASLVLVVKGRTTASGSDSKTEAGNARPQVY